MAEKRNLLNLAKTPDRLDPASKSALAAFNKLQLLVTPKPPDLAQLEKLMTKGKTTIVPAEFLLSFDGKTLHLFVKVGSTNVTLVKLELAAGRSPGVQRAVMEKLKDLALVDKADMDAFDKKHPPPPTLEEQKKLDQALAPLRIQLRDKSAELKKLQDEVAKLQEQMKPLLAKEKEFEARSKAN